MDTGRELAVKVIDINHIDHSTPSADSQHMQKVRGGGEEGRGRKERRKEGKGEGEGKERKGRGGGRRKGKEGRGGEDEWGMLKLTVPAAADPASLRRPYR